MAQFLFFLSLINQLFPLVLQTVKTVEAAFPQGGNGATKLALVQNVVVQAATVASGIEVTSMQLLPILTPMINGVVSLMNAASRVTAPVAAPTAPLTPPAH